MAPVTPEAHIEVRGLTMAFGTRVIQQELDFTIYRGDIFVIMGGSGCGKSTLLKHMLGLLEPAAGEILYDGSSFTRAGSAGRDAMRRGWGITFQSGGLFGAMTLGQNVGLPLQLYTGYSAAEIAEVVNYKLSLVGLGGFQGYYPAELSGGMRKRAALARAIALDPDILFFDEPSAGLDPISSRLLDDLIVQLKESMGATVVMVTHELPSIFDIATNSVYLDADTRTMIGYGDPRQLRDHSEQAIVRQFLSRSPAPPEGSASE
ncbi:ABC transporter ATP-binding protein [Kineobactrum salinum]|uniref:ATP-binding cassette domain-containing protein n=1 Tax=Kineobactrum salinum TaxID=2708301 RepID=A0A6C0U3C8_9GAMM|nr:ATP-binding cassette domain-containing protein [Kineobactrum salinum]QIB66672.1 ATP-binding cassette domain-containing protein [Kineobactrum salinum]